MLKVEDLSGRVPPRESVLERASTFALGSLSGRETRTYRVTATFPDGGRPVSPFAGDNLLQGSSVEVALQWQLTAAGPVPAPSRAPAAPPASPVPVVQPATPPGPPALLVTLRVPRQRVIKPRGLKAYGGCQIACKVRFTARSDSARVKKRGRRKAAKPKTLQKKLLRRERTWRKLRAGRERRVFLKLQPKARKS